LIDSVDSLQIFIEKGAPDGHQVTYKDAADEFINVRSGNVIFKVTQLAHSKFTRAGNDLKIRINISLKEALLGFTREITHLDGHVVNVDREDKVTKPGLMERFKGEGMPVFEHYGDFGDMLVTYIVDMP
jgi:DnaJ-class molecular chaperone